MEHLIFRTFGPLAEGFIAAQFEHLAGAV